MANRNSADPSRKKGRFGIFLMIYAWVLLIVGCAGLFLLRNYLLAYEDSQYKYRVEDYRLELEQSLPQAAVDALGDLDAQVQDPENNLRWAQALMEGVQLVKDRSASTEERPIYDILDAAGQPLGRVAFGVVDKGRYDLPVWGPVEEQFDFSPYYSTAEVTVPGDYSVYLGDRLLGPENIVEQGVPYAALEKLYPSYENLPRLVRYETVPYVGDPALRVCDETGRELSAEQLNEEVFLDRCPREIRARVEEYVPQFVNLYVLFSADIDNSAILYYGMLRPLVVPDSQLATRMHQAFEGFGYSATNAAVLQSTTINRITDLGENRYLVDVSYTTEVTGQDGPVMVNDRIQLVLFDLDGNLLADALYYV